MIENDNIKDNDTIFECFDYNNGITEHEREQIGIKNYLELF